MNNTYSIFVSSSDSYSDIWDVFFDMFHRFWPEYKGKIYLQTEEKEYQHEGLDIVCTRVGKRACFGETFRAGLDKVLENNILFFMIDYMLMGKVNTEKVEEYYQYYIQNHLDSLCLVNQGLPQVICENNKEIGKYLPSNHVFSYQVAFWKKSILYQMALPHENPWTSEWYGNKRAIKANLDIRAVNMNAPIVFVYNLAGCLHQGKWLPDAVDFLNTNHINVDFEKRGYYQNDYNSFESKIRIKKNMVLHGLKGSYWYKIKKV